MTPLDRLWYTVSIAHGGEAEGGIDLTRPPALGRKKKDWERYVTALVMLVGKATLGRSVVKLEFNRFLTRAKP